MPGKPNADSASEPFDDLKNIIAESDQYEQYIRKITALSNKIKSIAKDLYKKREKIKKIKTSSVYKELKLITKKEKDYTNWEIKNTYKNIYEKKKLTEKLNPKINELNALLKKRDDTLAELQRIPKQRVPNLDKNSLLTHDENALDKPLPAKVWKDDNWNIETPN